MPRNKISWSGIFISFFLTILIFLYYGCANMVPPGGGPIDSIPPAMIRALPEDSALNVNTPKLQLNFNEFIELKNPADEILISPYPVKQPLITGNLRTISVKWKDSLLPNTTYTIDFGASIADINEGNILRNYRYVFSTGNHIDSNRLSGRVILAETGKTDSTMWALLYAKEEDSTVAKETPLYVARVNAKGFFQFNNLPSGQYHLFALKDADGNKKYNQPIESFGFLDDQLDVPRDTLAATLYAFATEKEKKRDASSVKADKKQSDKLSYQTNLADGALGLTDTFTILFKERLISIDKASFSLFQDTLPSAFTPQVVYDSVNFRLQIRSNWSPGESYKLVLAKGFAKDSSGRSSIQNDTIRFRVKEEKEYGSVRVRFKQLDLSRNPRLVLYENETIVHNEALMNNEFFIKLFKPGSYQLAILYDKNGNGIWDPGDYFSKPRKQPEIVQAIDKPMTVKANWDNEMDIELISNNPQ